MDTAELTRRLHAIRDHNAWHRFHSPKNLATVSYTHLTLPTILLV